MRDTREFNRGEKVIWILPLYNKEPLRTLAEFDYYAGKKLAIRVETPTGQMICKIVNPDKVRKLSCAS